MAQLLLSFQNKLKKGIKLNIRILIHFNMKISKSPACNIPETHLLSVFVLFFSLGILLLNSQVSGQVNPATAKLQSTPIQQQVIQKYRVPTNLFQIQLVTVPPLVGRNYNLKEISSLLDSLGLQMGKAVPVVNKDRAGIIISQSPEARQSVRRKTPVDITYGIRVELGPAATDNYVTVPDYRRMNIKQALSRLTDDHLTIGQYGAIPSGQPADEVVEQFPQAGSKVAQNTPVSFKYSFGPQDKSVIVPRLVGSNYNQGEISVILRKSGLQLGKAVPVANNDSARIVIRQSPVAGQKVRLRTPVEITYGIREQPNYVIVPDYLKMNIDQALFRLPNDQLSRGLYTEIPSGQPAGEVVEQFPPAGSNVAPNTPVTLKFSSGPPQLIVPRLIGRSYNPEKISGLLDSLGLQMGKAIAVSNNDSAGIVTSQSPEALQRVRPKNPIDITYGIRFDTNPPSTSAYVIVPDYLRMNIKQALARLFNDRLTRGPYTEISSGQPAGEVFEQFPPGGSKVAPNTPVTFRYSSGPKLLVRIKVPRLIGLSLMEAADVLRNYQLFAGQLNEEISEKREGIVLYQSPEEGTEVDRGSAISMTYSAHAQKKLVRLPNVMDKRIETALQELKDSGFFSVPVFYVKSMATDSTVISQKPAAGTEVQKGSGVILVAAWHETPTPPHPWVLWVSTIVVISLLANFFRWKYKKKKIEPEEKEPELKFLVIPDHGKQTLWPDENTNPDFGLHFKIIPDKGIQNFKTK